MTSSSQLEGSAGQSMSVPSLPPQPKRGGFLTRLVLSLTVAGLFVWVIHRGGMPVVPTSAAFAHVKWWVVGAYLLTLGVVHWFRAWRWDYLLRPVARVPTRKIIGIAWIGFFAIMMLPLRMGEVVRPMLLQRDGRVSGSAAMGTIAAERVLDGLYVAILLALTMILVPRQPLTGVMFMGFPVAQIVTGAYATVGVFASALVVLGFFLFARSFAEKLTLTIVGWVSPALAQRLARMVGGLADGLKSLPDPKLMGPFMLQTTVYWVVNALGMWMLGWGCGLPMHPGEGFAVMGVLAMGILLPAGPGLFGTFQLAMYLALRMYFPEAMVRNEGAAYVFLMYVCQFVFTTTAGVIPLVLEHINPRDAIRD